MLEIDAVQSNVKIFMKALAGVLLRVAVELS